MKTFFKALRLLGVTAAVLIAVLAVFLFVFSRDIAPTDVSELIPPELPEVAAENNAFTYFMQAEALIPKPYEPEVLTQFILCNNITRSALLQGAHIARSGSLSEEQLAGLSEALKGIDETGQDWVRALKHAYCRDVAFFSGGFLADYLSRAYGYKSERFSRFKLQPNMVRELLAIPSREMIRNVQTDYSQVKFSSSEEWLNSAKYNAWNLKDEGGSIEQGYRGNKLQASARFKGEDYIFGIKKKQF